MARILSSLVFAVFFNSLYIEKKSYTFHLTLNNADRPHRDEKSQIAAHKCANRIRSPPPQQGGRGDAGEKYP